MIISTCDVCGLKREFDSSSEQKEHGWKNKDNNIICVNCRLNKLEEASSKT